MFKKRNGGYDLYIHPNVVKNWLPSAQPDTLKCKKCLFEYTFKEHMDRHIRFLYHTRTCKSNKTTKQSNDIQGMNTAIKDEHDIDRINGWKATQFTLPAEPTRRSGRKKAMNKNQSLEEEKQKPVKGVDDEGGQGDGDEVQTQVTTQPADFELFDEEGPSPWKKIAQTEKRQQKKGASQKQQQKKQATQMESSAPAMQFQHLMSPQQKNFTTNLKYIDQQILAQKESKAADPSGGKKAALRGKLNNLHEITLNVDDLKQYAKTVLKEEIHHIDGSGIVNTDTKLQRKVDDDVGKSNDLINKEIDDEEQIDRDARELARLLKESKRYLKEIDDDKAVMQKETQQCTTNVLVIEELYKMVLAAKEHQLKVMDDVRITHGNYQREKLTAYYQKQKEYDQQYKRFKYIDQNQIDAMQKFAVDSSQAKTSIMLPEDLAKEVANSAWVGDLPKYEVLKFVDGSAEQAGAGQVAAGQEVSGLGEGYKTIRNDKQKALTSLEVARQNRLDKDPAATDQIFLSLLKLRDVDSSQRMSEFDEWQEFLDTYKNEEMSIQEYQGIMSKAPTTTKGQGFFDM